MATELKTLGKLGYRDSGPVAGSSDYTTIIIIHGFGFNGANFLPMIPSAAKNNVRVILVNRRGHPGSDPLNEEERATIKAVEDASKEDAFPVWHAFMKDRALDIYDFLCQIVEKENLPAAQGDSGGIVLAWWSLGNIWLLPFLCHAAEFPVGNVDLVKYIRRIVLYDPPHHAIGYFDRPQGAYSPLSDPDILPQDRPKAFAVWVSGYYDHKAAPGGVEYHKAMASPPATLTKATPEEAADFFTVSAAKPGGADVVQRELGNKTEINVYFRKRVFFHLDREGPLTAWDQIPIRYIWCDSSAWMTNLAARLFRDELAEAQKHGRPLRDVEMVCLEGANHFVHWDDPERFTKALLD